MCSRRNDAKRKRNGHSRFLHDSAKKKKAPKERLSRHEVLDHNPRIKMKTPNDQEARLSKNQRQNGRSKKRKEDQNEKYKKESLIKDSEKRRKVDWDLVVLEKKEAVDQEENGDSREWETNKRARSILTKRTKRTLSCTL